MNELEIAVTVNELEIVNIHQNDTANITIDAYDDYTFKGIVTDMAISTANTSSLTSSDEVSTYEVKIRLLPESYQNLLTNAENTYPFRPGMSKRWYLRYFGVSAHPEDIPLSLRSCPP